ncbi:hypothetical protein LP43_2563 [Methylophaga thiooxydans]|uniref:Uncharacterized protein n=1 Tax=Methylophaga thiooxydans TaxID=392484 RepID=A0A0A0BFD5_9GAMM|nr:hypothetical protein LP43_2563 [Methylophaga thiooxydans]
MYGRYRYPANATLEHHCSSYAANTAAVDGHVVQAGHGLNIRYK